MTRPATRGMIVLLGLLATTRGDFKCADARTRPGSRPLRGAIAHRQTGTGILKKAHRVAAALMRATCGVVTVAPPWLGQPLPVSFETDIMMDRGWPAGPPRRLVHLLRALDDWIVSSYLSHRRERSHAGVGVWTMRLRRDCGTRVVALQPWARRWFHASCAFPNPGVPAPRRDESYSAYLRRLPTRDGLAAEQAFAMNVCDLCRNRCVCSMASRLIFAQVTLGAMERVMAGEYEYDTIKQHEYGTVGTSGTVGTLISRTEFTTESVLTFDAYHAVCLEDLVASREACGAAWAAAAATLFGKGPWGILFGERVANATCAGDASPVEPHHRGHLRALVRANDAALFGGRLAAVQRRVAARGCGGEWTTPAPTPAPAPATPASMDGRTPARRQADYALREPHAEAGQTDMVTGPRTARRTHVALPRARPPSHHDRLLA